MSTYRTIAALGLLVAGVPSQAQQALVRSYENPSLEIGQAYLSHYGPRCLAILPTHVVEEAGDVAAFLREGHDGLLGESTAFADLGDDVSVADVTGGVTSSCGYSTVAVSRDVGSRIRSNALGSIRSINGDGTVAQLSVTIIDDDGQRLLRVQPTNDLNQLRKGQSGSLLMSGDTPIGMLLSVDARFDVGTVIRLDAMFEKIDDFVRQENRSAAAGHERTAPASAAAAVATSDGAITSWSALPVDAAHRAANLVAAGSEPEWQAAVDQWPVAIELDLPGDRVAIAGFELDATGIIDTGLLPATVEIMVSSTEDGRRWRSAWGGGLIFVDGVATIQVAPSWARHVRLVISNAANGGDRVALRRFRAIPAD